MKLLTTIIVLVLLFVGGCSATASEGPSDAVYDDECRLRIYEKTLPMEEYNTFAERYADLRVDEGLSHKEAFEELGVPYYDQCLVHYGAGAR